MYIIAGHATQRGIREWSKDSKLTTHQISALEAVFANNYNINTTTLMELAEQTSLAEPKILGWFLKRRNLIRRAKIEQALSLCKYIYLYIQLMKTFEA